MFRFGFMDQQQEQQAHAEEQLPVDASAAVEEIEPALHGTDAAFAPLVVGPLQLQRVVGEGNLASNPETDLIPGVYEGGLKIWECSVDLAEHLAAHFADFAGVDVIELGCGHGIPGIVALAKGARVTFSDFNAEVLQRVTWKNICVNAYASIDEVRSVARCFAGDWTALSRRLGDEKFGVILSAETLYTEASCAKVVRFIADHLTETGSALIATKRYYFGVGGGSGTLLDQLRRYPQLQAERVKLLEDGRSNTREIFLITRRHA